MSETRLTPERRAELEVLTTPRHYTCEDAWYSCPKSEEGCSNDTAGDACNCGAEAEAAAMREALAEVDRLTARWEALKAWAEQQQRLAELAENGHDVPFDDVAAEMTRLECEQ